jgi:hypothetical protein
MRGSFLILIILFPFFVFSQTKIDRFNLLWANYQNTLRLNNRWEVLSDAQFRSKEITRSWFLFAFRSGLSYTLNDKYKVAAGFCWFGVPASKSMNFTLRNEWRPWQDVSIFGKINRTNIIQRVRLEERFLPIQSANNGTIYEFILRMRYKIDFEKFINHSQWMIRVGDELMVNPGFVGNGRFFDQNRAYAALGYRFSNQFQCNLMYIKIYQWRNAAETLEDQNVFRINFIHQLSLIK